MAGIDEQFGGQNTVEKSKNAMSAALREAEQNPESVKNEKEKIRRYREELEQVIGVGQNEFKNVATQLTSGEAKSFLESSHTQIGGKILEIAVKGRELKVVENKNQVFPSLDSLKVQLKGHLELQKAEAGNFVALEKSEKEIVKAEGEQKGKLGGITSFDACVAEQNAFQASLAKLRVGVDAVSSKGAAGGFKGQVNDKIYFLEKAAAEGKAQAQGIQQNFQKAIDAEKQQEFLAKNLGENFELYYNVFNETLHEYGSTKAHLLNNSALAGGVKLPAALVEAQLKLVDKSFEKLLPEKVGLEKMLLMNREFPGMFSFQGKALNLAPTLAFLNLPQGEQLKISEQVKVFGVDLEQAIRRNFDAESCPPSAVQFRDGLELFNAGQLAQSKAVLTKFIETNKDSEDAFMKRLLPQAREILGRIDQQLTVDDGDYFKAQALAEQGEIYAAKSLLLQYLKNANPRGVHYQGAAKELLMKIALVQLEQVRERLKEYLPKDEAMREENASYGDFLDGLQKVEHGLKDGLYFDFETACKENGIDANFKFAGAESVLDDEKVLSEKGRDGFLILARKYRGLGKYEVAEKYFQKYFAGDLLKLSQDPARMKALQKKHMIKIQASKEVDLKMRQIEDFHKKMQKDWQEAHPWDWVQYRDQLVQQIFKQTLGSVLAEEQQKIINTSGAGFLGGLAHFGNEADEQAWQDYMSMKGLQYKGTSRELFSLSDEDYDRLITQTVPQIALITIASAVSGGVGGAVTGGILRSGATAAARQAGFAAVEGAALSGEATALLEMGAASAARRSAASGLGFLANNTTFVLGNGLLSGDPITYAILRGEFSSPMVNENTGRAEQRNNLTAFGKEWLHNAGIIGGLGAVGKVGQALKVGAGTAVALEFAGMGVASGQITMDDFAMIFGLKGGHAVLERIKSSLKLPEPAAEAIQPAETKTIENLQAAAEKEGGLVLYHGGLPENTNVDSIDLNRNGSQQNKKGRSYGGFYLADYSSKDWANKYAEGRNGIVHGFRIDKAARIFVKADGNIDRLSQAQRDELARDYDLIKGKDLLGRVQYVLLNGSVVKEVGLEMRETKQQTVMAMQALNGEPQKATNSSTIGRSPWLNSTEKMALYPVLKQFFGFDYRIAQDPAYPSEGTFSEQKDYLDQKLGELKVLRPLLDGILLLDFRYKVDQDPAYPSEGTFSGQKDYLDQKLRELKVLRPLLDSILFLDPKYKVDQDPAYQKLRTEAQRREYLEKLKADKELEKAAQIPRFSSFPAAKPDPVLKRFMKEAKALVKTLRVELASLSKEDRQAVIADKVRELAVKIREQIAENQRQLGEIFEVLLQKAFENPGLKPEVVIEKLLKMVQGGGVELSPAELANIKIRVKNLLEKQQVVRDTYEKNKANPRNFFIELFGFEPQGEIELVGSHMSVNFIIKSSADFERIFNLYGGKNAVEKDVGGLNLPYAKNPALNKLVNVVNAFTPKYEAGRREIITHEEQHTINGILKPAPLGGFAILLGLLQAKNESDSRTTFRKYLDEAFHHAQDEVSAYMQQGVGKDAIVKILSSNVLYDFWSGLENNLLENNLKAGDASEATLKLLQEYRNLYYSRLASLVEASFVNPSPMLTMIPKASAAIAREIAKKGITRDGVRKQVSFAPPSSDGMPGDLAAVTHLEPQLTPEERKALEKFRPVENAEGKFVNNFEDLENKAKANPSLFESILNDLILFARGGLGKADFLTRHGLVISVAIVDNFKGQYEQAVGYIARLKLSGRAQDIQALDKLKKKSPTVKNLAERIEYEVKDMETRLNTPGFDELKQIMADIEAGYTGLHDGIIHVFLNHPNTAGRELLNRLLNTGKIELTPVLLKKMAFYHDSVDLLLKSAQKNPQLFGKLQEALVAAPVEVGRFQEVTDPRITLLQKYPSLCTLKMIDVLVSKRLDSRIVQALIKNTIREDILSQQIPAFHELADDIRALLLQQAKKFFAEKFVDKAKPLQAEFDALVTQKDAALAQRESAQTEAEWNKYQGEFQRVLEKLNVLQPRLDRVKTPEAAVENFENLPAEIQEILILNFDNPHLDATLFGKIIDPASAEALNPAENDAKFSDRDTYFTGKLLGSGGTAHVYEGFYLGKGSKRLVYAGVKKPYNLAALGTRTETNSIKNLLKAKADGMPMDNIMDVYGIAPDGSTIVMEVVETERNGRKVKSLEDLAERKNNTPAKEIMQRLYEAVASAEALSRYGLTDTDTKPENYGIMRGPNGREVTKKVDHGFIFTDKQLRGLPKLDYAVYHGDPADAETIEAFRRGYEDSWSHEGQYRDVDSQGKPAVDQDGKTVVKEGKVPLYLSSLDGVGVSPFYWGSVMYDAFKDGLPGGKPLPAWKLTAYSLGQSILLFTDGVVRMNKVVWNAQTSRFEPGSAIEVFSPNFTQQRLPDLTEAQRVQLRTVANKLMDIHNTTTTLGSAKAQIDGIFNY